ncbi:transcriptional regulator, IclR family protein [Sulfobacillus acidophilus TPY]|uniref:Glycerol operon regulatory protein n=1 Tax=Sulfobacillus acidophilus (strain ATCC 700253 / DSM 10332 / NAL) TaxID=679936 RepID=G8U0A9_SULAD|nr:transcriptional regulator, IclR family protein [Sulfobacillus acidophilus TPY]AEW06451.1 transcriptional regulator, IclR family [Sulfobacillus acidophilus DSM 10332]
MKAVSGTRSVTAGLQSVTAALKILRLFSVERTSLGITEVARHLNVAKSTAHRLMTSLMEEGFVYQDPKSRRYHLGLAVLGLGGIMTADSDLWMAAAPYLTELTMRTGEASHIAVQDGLYVVYLHKVESHHPVKILTHLGRRNPLYATGSGKLLLAYAEADLVDAVVEQGLTAYTVKTLTDPVRLREQLQHIREQGYAVSRDELRDHVTSIAAPVFNHRRQVVAAVNIVAPSHRVPAHVVGERARAVVKTADRISKDLGFRPERRATARTLAD